MTSNKEEVLAGDDIGGNLAVIDSNILTESNDLESEVAWQQQFQNTGDSFKNFYCAKIAEKHINKKGIKSSSISCKWRVHKDLRRETATACF